MYFEIVSTLALLLGLAVGNLIHTGQGFNADPATLDAHEVAAYAGQAKAQHLSDFLMHIIPNTIVDAFAKGDILEVLLVALLFGFALSAVGPRGKPLADAIEALTHTVFKIVGILMRFAPLGAFGAMAFTVGIAARTDLTFRAHSIGGPQAALESRASVRRAELNPIFKGIRDLQDGFTYVRDGPRSCG